MISSALPSSPALKAQGRPQKDEKGEYHTQQLHKEVKRKAQTAGEELIQLQCPEKFWDKILGN